MAPGVRPRVLVIDDEPNVRVFICDLLKDLGYETDEADNGVQGVALLEQRRYDLVITDLQMPHLTGWGVVNAVRGQRPTMPMIMISGFATDDDVRQAQRLGVPLLDKPFSVIEFRRVVRELLTAEASQPGLSWSETLSVRLLVPATHGERACLTPRAAVIMIAVGKEPTRREAGLPHGRIGRMLDHANE